MQAADGGWRCGGWTVAAHGDGLALHSPGGGGQDLDGHLDGLRALCVAHWAAHPDGAPAPTTTAADDTAGEALRRWGLAGQP